MMADKSAALEKIKRSLEQYQALDKAFMLENDEGLRASMRAFDAWRDIRYDPAQKPEPKPPLLSKFTDDKDKSYVGQVTHYLRNGTFSITTALDHLGKSPPAEQGTLYAAIVEICEDHFVKGRKALVDLLDALETQKDKIPPDEVAIIERIKGEIPQALAAIDEVMEGGKELKAALGIGSGEGRSIGGDSKKTE